MAKESTGDRRLDSLRDRAASKIIWGEDEESVYKFLRKEGVAPELADQLIDQAGRERAAIIRQRSLIKFIAGVIGALVCGGLFAFLFFSPGGYTYRIRGGSFKVMAALGVGLVICGGFALKHGLALLTGRKMGSAIDD